MLSFEGNKIIFNEEVGTQFNYKLTSFPFGNNKQIKEFLPHCEIVKEFKVSEIKDKKLTIGLSQDEFFAFIKEWAQNSIPYTLTDEEILGWCNLYISGIKEVENKFKEHSFDEPFFPRFDIELYNIMPKKVDSPIKFDSLVKPEISWAILDCFEEMSSGRKSNLENYVNAYIQDNIDRLLFWKEKCNFFGPNLSKLNIPLTKKITLRSIDYQNPQSLYYFYCPFCNEMIRTNYKFIQKSFIALREEFGFK